MPTLPLSQGPFRKADTLTLAIFRWAISWSGSGALQEANRRNENIGARRLYTVLEALLEEISFSAPEMTEDRLRVDAAMVRAVLAPILEDQELGKYIL